MLSPRPGPPAGRGKAGRCRLYFADRNGAPAVTHAPPIRAVTRSRHPMPRLALLFGLLFACAQVNAATEIETLLAAAQQGNENAVKALRMKLAAGEGSDSAELGRVTEQLRDASVKGDAQAQNRYAFLLE